MVMRIFLTISGIVLLVLVAACEPRSCEAHIDNYIKENDLSSDNLKTNGEGFWWVEKDGEQLTNCLASNGRVQFVTIKGVQE